MAFPDALDNTIISSAKRCLTQARYAYIENLSLPGESVHLHFGGAMAYGLEVARRAFHDEKLSAEAAVAKGAQAAMDYYGDFDPPHKSPKTRENVGRAIQYYFTIWPLDSDPVQPSRSNDGGLRVEWRFKHPLPDLTHPDHGGPIYFVGRSDMLPEIGGFLHIEDDKSASQLGEKWGQQWKLDAQFIGYIWAAQQSGILVPEEPGHALIRGVGIYSPKYVRKSTGAKLKQVTQDMIDSGEAVYDMMSSFGYAQQMVSHAPHMVARWLRETQRIVRRMIYAYLNDPHGDKGEWDMALDKAACGHMGGCSFTGLCVSQNPDQWKAINFIERKWDPLETV